MVVDASQSVVFLFCFFFWGFGLGRQHHREGAVAAEAASGWRKTQMYFSTTVERLLVYVCTTKSSLFNLEGA